MVLHYPAEIQKAFPEIDVKWRGEYVALKPLYSIQDNLYSTFYDAIVAKQLYRKFSFYNRFIYIRNLIYLTDGKILYTV